MKKIHLLLLAGAAFVAASCTHETVVYRTRNVYTKPTYTKRTYTREYSSPTTIPGAAQRMPEPGAPGNYKAESAQ